MTIKHLKELQWVGRCAHDYATSVCGLSVDDAGKVEAVAVNRYVEDVGWAVALSDAIKEADKIEERKE